MFKSLSAILVLLMPLALQAQDTTESDGWFKALSRSIDRRYELALDEANYRTKDSDCVVVEAGCPLPCSSYVNSTEVAQIKDLAAQIIAEHEQRAVCVSSCRPTRSAKCENRKCVRNCEP